jgi:nitroreductase|tara:strand:+ start:1313 stop:1900 length:588 start_codon:yes stop_codon:yes gene_type:complete
MKYNLSEITEVIRNRRTIYPEFFSDRKVHREQIELLLNNAIWAPTHGNTQPWRFKVMMEDALPKLSDFMVSTYKELTPVDQHSELRIAKMTNRPRKSSAVIAICMERQASEKISEQDEMLAVACAVQNIHLTCTAYGLGGFWATPGIIHSQQMKDYLGLGEKDKCLGLFFVGYPAGEWPKGQRKPIEYITEWKTQ